MRGSIPWLGSNLKQNSMRKFEVNGYQLAKDPKTWDYKRVKLLYGLNVEIHANDMEDEAENIGVTLCRKYNFEAFEVISFGLIN